MKTLTVKFMDELGNCYAEEVIPNNKFLKNDLIKTFLDGQVHSRNLYHDIIIYRKSNGEELWMYANE